MSKFRLTALVTISMSTVVEADSPEAAKEIAEARGLCSLGDPKRHGYSEDTSWVHSGEIDGTLEKVEVEGEEEGDA